MILNRAALMATVLALSGACQKSDESSSPVEGDRAVAPPGADATPHQDEPTRSPKADVGSAEKLAAAVGLADGLPDLKPVIDKPFPDGATEEQVCEAIENTGEKDLWVRFGHLVPMYKWGSIFIVQAKKSDTAAIDKVVVGDGATAAYKNCNDAKTFIYAPSLPDVTREIEGQVTGRLPLIEKFSNQLGIKTLESFSFDNDQERLSDYCRADAELCESLVKLNFANEGTGMCSEALVECRIRTEDPRYQATMSKCMKAPRELLRCLMVSDGMAARDACETRLRQHLCP